MDQPHTAERTYLESDSWLRLVCISTAQNWLLALGFRFKYNAKCIYHNGYEGEDVGQDRAEKLVIARLLEDASVRFVRRDCEDIVWPALHPG